MFIEKGVNFVNGFVVVMLDVLEDFKDVSE